MGGGGSLVDRFLKWLPGHVGDLQVTDRLNKDGSRDPCDEIYSQQCSAVFIPLRSSEDGIDYGKFLAQHNSTYSTNLRTPIRTSCFCQLPPYACFSTSTF